MGAYPDGANLCLCYRGIDISVSHGGPDTKVYLSLKESVDNGTGSSLACYFLNGRDTSSNCP